MGASLAVAAGIAVLRIGGFDAVCLGQVLCSVSDPAEQAEQVHLSWRADPSTSLTISWWLADVTDEPYAEVRPAGQEAWTRIPAEAASVPSNGIIDRRGWYLSATATDLLPATAYEYRVANGAGALQPTSGNFRTHTAPAGEDAEFSFIFFADTGLIGRPDQLSSGTAAIRDFIQTSDVAFLLGGGDYAIGNADGRFVFPADAGDEWFRQWQGVLTRVPLMAQYGNHESFLREELVEWTSRFGHPGGFSGDSRAYSFDVGSVHFTAMYAPGDGYIPTDELLAWLDADLADARRRGATWLIVFQHDSLFGHGQSHPADPRVREAIVPILERHRVDLHLAAQDQSYERTYPLAERDGQLRVMSEALDAYEAGTGVVYAKVSPAGKRSERTQGFSLLPDAIAEEIAVRNDSSFNIARIDVQGRDTITVTIWAWQPGNEAPFVLDRFTLSKHDDPG